MNARPNSFRLEKPSSTISDPSVIDITVLNKIVDAISNADLYESEDEPRPHALLITKTAKALSGISVAKAEIAPFFGEINVTWKEGGIRVKATFGPDPALFSVYRERFEEGHVTQSHLEENANLDYLEASLQWLADPFVNV